MTCNAILRIIALVLLGLFLDGCSKFKSRTYPPPPCASPEICIKQKLISDMTCIRTQQRYAFKNEHPSRSIFLSYTTTTIYHDGSSGPTYKKTPRLMAPNTQEIADCEFSPSTDADYLRENVVTIDTLCWSDDCQPVTPLPSPKPEQPLVSCVDKCNQPGNPLCLRLSAANAAERPIFDGLGRVAYEIAIQALPTRINTDQFENALTCTRDDISLGLSYASWFGDQCGFLIDEIPPYFRVENSSVETVGFDFRPNLGGGFSRKPMAREAIWEFEQESLSPTLDFEVSSPSGKRHFFESVKEVSFTPGRTVVSGRAGHCVKFAHEE